MPNPTPSAQAPTSETPAERFRRLVASFAATLDPDFPSVVIVGGAGGIDDASDIYGNDTNKPAFVAADDAAFRG
jgi:hypothetical protein